MSGNLKRAVAGFCLALCLRPLAAARVHGTPGYPFGITAGVTLRLFGKD